MGRGQPVCQLAKIIDRILNWILYYTGSQCNKARTCVMWFVLVSRVAASFWTNCSHNAMTYLLLCKKNYSNLNGVRSGHG